MADNKEIMRAYDIRGLVGTHIDNDTVFSLGLGFSKLVHAREDLHSPIIVGRDARSSSEEFAKQFISGLTLGGIDVIDIGLCTSPMTYFALHHLHAGGCVMITASHNPKEYNGIKLNNNKGLNLSPQHEAKLLYEYLSLDEEGQKSRYHDTQGKVTHENVLEPYLDFLSSKLTLHTPLRIVVDSANSVSAIPFVPLATRNQHLSVCELYTDIIADFPHHDGDPSQEENLEDVKRKVVETKSDFGVAFDGDADRAGFVDHTGKVIPADIIGAIISDYLLEKHSGAEIVHDVFCTKAISDLAQQKNTQAICAKVGRKNIVAHMSENENIIFGIEKSGHFFHRDFFGLDNGILTFIKIVDILNASGKSLSELAQQYHTYENTPVINLTVEDPDRCLEHVKSAFSHYTISELDGVTIESDDFRFTVRKSNTEPLLRIAGEAKTTELLEDIQQKILDVIQ